MKKRSKTKRKNFQKHLKNFLTSLKNFIKQNLQGKSGRYSSARLGGLASIAAAILVFVVCALFVINIPDNVARIGEALIYGGFAAIGAKTLVAPFVKESPKNVDIPKEFNEADVK